MANAPQPLARRIAAVLPFALPVLGGMVGIFHVNTTAHGNPLIGVVLGALAGWALAFLIVKVLENRSFGRDLQTDKDQGPD
ncbi:hypothetical protein PEL8287_00535 [Roseovarius litorisediminis]|uniref:Uncharacterized protein n=1 Tax=Roseovarius litorisediminis TaxID=1312363 RepID=A0A1Y5RBP7_9RHOB|nr:hypothetical protein [Roseovarius litorisediminis]SLN13559.1 hypothetical protein PEL8287_00535 [Roseovarius litorisediminis]